LPIFFCKILGLSVIRDDFCEKFQFPDPKNTLLINAKYELLNEIFLIFLYSLNQYQKNETGGGNG